MILPRSKLRHLFVPLAAVLGLPVTAWGSTPAPWGHTDWGYRIEFTAKADSRPSAGTLTDFPLLLSLDGANHAGVFSRAESDGSDLLVTRGDGATVLDREIVGYDVGAMEAEIWVRADALSLTDNRFYLYYDNPGTTLAAASPGTWSPEYRVVYHFDDDPGAGSLTDSGPLGVDITLDPTKGWTSSDSTRAQIHQGWFFNGTTHWMASNGISTQDSSYVISAWLLNTEPSVDFVLQANPLFWHISSQRNPSQPRPDYARSGVTARFRPNPLPLGAYHLFSWVFDGVSDTLAFYYDGERQSIHTFTDPPGPVYTGVQINPQTNQPVGVLGPMFFNNQDLHTGGADEFRIREGVLSGDWIRTEFRNQKDPIGFYDFGPEEALDVTAVGPEPHRRSGLVLAQNVPNPFSRGTSIRFALESAGKVRLSVYSVTGRRIAGLVDEPLGPGTHERAWDGRMRGGQNAPSGVYFLRLEKEGEVASVKLQLRR